MKRNYLRIATLTLAVVAVGLVLIYQFDPTLGRIFAQQPQNRGLPAPSAQWEPARPNDVHNWPIPHTTAPRQVKFEVLIMELNAQKLHGKDFHLAKELGVEDRPQPSPDVPAPIVAALSQREFRLLTRSLTLSEAGKVLSRPSINTIDGQPAEIHSGGEIPLVSVERIVNGRRAASMEHLEFGTMAEITPHFVADDTLRVEATFTISELAEPTKDGVPRVVMRRTNVTGQVKFGQVLIVAEPDETVQRGAGQQPGTPERTGENDAAAKLEESLLLVAISPTGVDAAPPAQGAVSDTSAAPLLDKPQVAKSGDRVAPIDSNEHPATVNQPVQQTAAHDEGLRNFELVVPRDNLVASAAELTLQPEFHVDLYGREFDDGEGADLHSVLKHVAVRRWFVRRDTVTLNLALSPRDTERLNLALRHCRIIPRPSGASDDVGMAPSLPKGEDRRLDTGNFAPDNASNSIADSKPAQIKSAPGFAPAGKTVQPPSQTPLRSELHSLREEVRALRGDVQRILQLLQPEDEESAEEVGSESLEPASGLLIPAEGAVSGEALDYDEGLEDADFGEDGVETEFERAPGR